MARFSREQVEQQICDVLIRDKFPEAVAHSAAMRGADHYDKSANASLAGSIAIAKTYAKPLKRVKGKPDRPHVPGRRMGRR